MLTVLLLSKRRGMDVSNTDVRVSDTDLRVSDNRTHASSAHASVSDTHADCPSTLKKSLMGCVHAGGGLLREHGGHVAEWKKADGTL